MKCLPKDNSQNFRFLEKEPLQRHLHGGFEELDWTLAAFSLLAGSEELGLGFAAGFKQLLVTLVCSPCLLEVFSALMDKMLGTCFPLPAELADP